MSDITVGICLLLATMNVGFFVWLHIHLFE